MRDFRQLFPSKAEADIAMLSCAHVIPKENLLTQVITLGPSRRQMEFKYDNRNDDSLVSSPSEEASLEGDGIDVSLPLRCLNQVLELGALVSSVINLIPDGVVVFLPSYAFLTRVKDIWQKKGLLDKLDARKKVRTCSMRRPEAAASRLKTRHVR